MHSWIDFPQKKLRATPSLRITTFYPLSKGRRGFVEKSSSIIIDYIHTNIPYKKFFLLGCTYYEIFDDLYRVETYGLPGISPFIQCLKNSCKGQKWGMLYSNLRTKSAARISNRVGPRKMFRLYHVCITALCGKILHASRIFDI